MTTSQYNDNSVIIYKGPSAIDGKEIIVVLTGLTHKSTNPKTGGVLQTYIMNANTPPIQAANIGEDISVCGNCKHRAVNNKSCYVNLFFAPRIIYDTYSKGRYLNLYTEKESLKAYDSFLSELAEVGKDKIIRLGSYGDPSAVPLELFNSLTSKAKAILGYTHQWKKCNEGFKKLCMASVDSATEAEEAKKAGWRYFRVKTEQMEKLDGEVICPASHEKGRVLTCEKCTACCGIGRNFTSNIVINVHGARKSNFK
jgi:hypothetical protein